jgi:hypothetical protein
MMGSYADLVAKFSDVLWGTTVLVMLVSTSRVLSHLKGEHPQIYTSLGSPTVVSGRWNPNRDSFWKYVQSKAYLRLNDSELNTRVRWFKFSYIAFVISCVPLLIFNW